MDWLITKTLCSSGIFIFSLIGIVVSRFADNHHTYFYGEAFTSGAFLGFAFFHMIPHYLRNSDYNFDYHSVILVSTLCLFYLFTVVAKKRKRNDYGNNVSYIESMLDVDASQVSMKTLLIPYFEDNGLIAPKIVQVVLMILMLSNSIMLGISLGITNKSITTLPLFTVISIQKLFELIAIGIQLAKFGLSNLIIWLYSLIYSLITPIVVIFSSLYLCCQDLSLMTTLNAISAATFILIGCTQWYRIFISPYEYKKKEIISISILFILGLMLMSIILIGWKKQDIIS